MIIDSSPITPFFKKLIIA